MCEKGEGRGEKDGKEGLDVCIEIGGIVHGKYKCKRTLQ
jgi:hypothetical protein